MRNCVLVFILLSFLTLACKKNVDSNTGTSVSLLNSGIDNFTLQQLNFTADTATVYFTAVLSPTSIKEDVNITVGVDDASRISYNAASSYLLYDPFPDSCYSFTAPTVQIKSSGTTAVFSITFYKNKIDFTHSQMLPISLINAEGLVFDDTLKTLYFHINGNFLTSNTYNNLGTRIEYNGLTVSDSIENVITCPPVKYFSAVTANTVAIDYADLGSAGWQYIATVDSVTNAITMVPNSVIKLQTGGNESTFVTDLATYDADTKTFHFITHYINTTGKLRVVDETLTKQ